MPVIVKGPFGEHQPVDHAVDQLINQERWGKRTDPEGEQAQIDTMQRVVKAVVSVLTDDQKRALAVLLDFPVVCRGGDAALDDRAGAIREAANR